MAVSERRVRPMDLSDPEHDARGSRPGNKAVSPSFKKDQIFNYSLIMNVGCIDRNIARGDFHSFFPLGRMVKACAHFVDITLMINSLSKRREFSR